MLRCVRTNRTDVGFAPVLTVDVHFFPFFWPPTCSKAEDKPRIRALLYEFGV